MGKNKNTLDDWWSSKLAKDAFDPQTGIFSGHSHTIYAVDPKTGKRPTYFGSDGLLYFAGTGKRVPRRGGAIDIHKWIARLPSPQGGFTPSKYKYMGS